MNKGKTIVEMFNIRTTELKQSVDTVYFKDEQWIYETNEVVNERVKNIACGLLSTGHKKGDKIAIISDTRHEWTKTDFAILFAGCITVGIYHTNTAEQVQYILNNSQSRTVFVEDKIQLEKIIQIKSEIPHIKQIISFEKIKDPGKNIELISLEELEAQGQKYSASNSDELDNITQSILPDDTATIIYTSGTTGPPKGVVLSHHNFVSVVYACSSYMPIDKTERTFFFLPMAHAMQRMLNYLVLVTDVQTFYYRSLETVIEDIQFAKPTIMASVPRIFEKMYTRIMDEITSKGLIKNRMFYWALQTGKRYGECVKAQRRISPTLKARYRLAKRLVLNKITGIFGGEIKYMISGAAPISINIQNFLFSVGLLVMEAWGMTETSSPATLNNPRSFKFGSVGKPLPCNKIKLSSDNEILIKGDNVFKGYYNDEETNAKCFIEDGWFKTGDIGHIDPEGYLHITDRKKNIIITAGGKNIAPANIESMLNKHRLIANAFIAGDRRKYLVSLITLDNEELEKWKKTEKLEDKSIQELIEHPRLNEVISAAVYEVNRNLAKFETIKKFKILHTNFTIENNMLTPTNKIIRKNIQEKFREDIDSLYDEIWD